MELQGSRFWHDANDVFALHSNATGSVYRLRAQTVALVLARHIDGRRHLDVGCGTGHLCNLMLCLGFESRGIDPSPAQIEIARATAARLEGNSQDCFEVGDVESGFSCQTFDAVTALGVLPYVSDWRAFLAAIKSRSAPGGLVVVTVTRPFSLFTLISVWRHLQQPSASREWRWVLHNLIRTGLWSGGFKSEASPWPMSSTRSLCEIARDLNLEPVTTIDLYNVAALDNHPLERSLLASFFARYLSWCRVLFFRVSDA